MNGVLWYCVKLNFGGKSMNYANIKAFAQIIVTLLEVLKVNNKKLTQTAWNYMNDSLRTEVFVRYDPETIACSCIYLSARLLRIPLPNKPAWYMVFGVSEQDVTDISHIILSLYTRKKPDPEKLEKIVEELKKTHQEAKLKAKGLSLNNQVGLSPASQPCCSPRNGTKSPLNDIKKERNDSKHDSPKYSKDMNHRKRRSLSPLEDGYQSSEGKKRAKTSSSGSATSRSPSPRRKQRTPPRGFKDSRRSRSRSRSKSHNPKKSKHHSSHKRKHSLSLSPSSPNHHSIKKLYKNKHSEKASHRGRSRSRSQERNHHSSSNSLHDKTHKSRSKDRVKESHHSKEKKKR